MASTTAPQGRESHKKLKPKPKTVEVVADAEHGAQREADGARGKAPRRADAVSGAQRECLHRTVRAIDQGRMTQSRDPVRPNVISAA